MASHAPISGKASGPTRIISLMATTTRRPSEVFRRMISACTTLRNEVYEGSTLDAQLNDQAREFFADTFRNEFDVAARKANISKILDWYSKDFDGSDEHVLMFISRFVPPALSADIKVHLSDWDISYKDYDWSLNGR
jgi:hypothetical protein